MPGEADYALANELLSRSIERYAEAHPETRCLSLEWSIWSGVGLSHSGFQDVSLVPTVTPWSMRMVIFLRFQCRHNASSLSRIRRDIKKRFISLADEFRLHRCYEELRESS